MTPGWTALWAGVCGLAGWGPLAGGPEPADPRALPPLPPGFRCEALPAPPEGSERWSCLAVDREGRLWIGADDDRPRLWRATGSAQEPPAALETLAVPLRAPESLCWGAGSLYAIADGPRGRGLYRLEDSNLDGRFTEAGCESLARFGDCRRTNCHAVAVAPGGAVHVFLDHRVGLPEGVAEPTAIPPPAADSLVPPPKPGDIRGTGPAWGGCVLRASEGRQPWELFCTGLRCACRGDFDAEGELFVGDADEPQDEGLSWYRPLRALHAVRGGDYGWRAGGNQRPGASPDTLPAAVEIGLGTPTAIAFGTRSRFPAPYRQGLFLLDGAHGRIVVVQLEPRGASYAGVYRPFLHAATLRLRDLAFGGDGALYVLAAGSGTAMRLLRVSWQGAGAEAAATPDAPARARTLAGTQARSLRRELEALPPTSDPAALGRLWAHLGTEDRWLRYAARRALEACPAGAWAGRALGETNVPAALASLLALVRTGRADARMPVLGALRRLAREELDEVASLEALRVLSLAFVRWGAPEVPVRQVALETLTPHYPAPAEALNRELCPLLIHLESPEAIPRTLALLNAAPTLEEQLHYLVCLQAAKTGWTLEQRRDYFRWLHRVRAGGAHRPEWPRWLTEADRDPGEGPGLNPLVTRLAQQAQAALAPAELADLRAIILGQALAPVPAATNRTVVTPWTVEDFLPDLPKVDRGRSFAQGQAAFLAGQCITCHRLGASGGSVGPDLTAVASRLDRRRLLESILLPSKVIGEEFRNTTLTLKDDDDLTGRIVAEDEEKVVLIVSALTGARTTVRKADIASRATSQLSPMPEGLANILTCDEVLDLLAYLEAGGKPSHSVFTPAP